MYEEAEVAEKRAAKVRGKKGVYKNKFDGDKWDQEFQAEIKELRGIMAEILHLKEIQGIQSPKFLCICRG